MLHFAVLVFAILLSCFSPALAQTDPLQQGKPSMPAAPAAQVEAGVDVNANAAADPLPGTPAAPEAGADVNAGLEATAPTPPVAPIPPMDSSASATTEVQPAPAQDDAQAAPAAPEAAAEPAVQEEMKTEAAASTEEAAPAPAPVKKAAKKKKHKPAQHRIRSAAEAGAYVPPAPGTVPAAPVSSMPDSATTGITLPSGLHIGGTASTTTP